MKIVVLISGSGSNLQSIIDAIGRGEVDATIAAVISNKADAYGLERARLAEIPHLVISNTDYDSREAYDAALADNINVFAPDLVVLAGFMRILSSHFVAQYYGRLINIHPSILPKFKGVNTHQRAIDSGEDEHGATVHLVTEELDGGPVILQAWVPIYSSDTTESLAKRVLVEEHKILPKVIQWFVTGKVQIDGNQLIINK